MKRLLKLIFSILITVYFAAVMFYCFVAGAPQEQAAAIRYMVAAAGFSLLVPAFMCACIHYIRYLQKKLEDREKQE